MGTRSRIEIRDMREPVARRDDVSSGDFLDHLCLHLDVSREAAEALLRMWMRPVLKERLVARRSVSQRRDRQ